MGVGGWTKEPRVTVGPQLEPLLKPPSECQKPWRGARPWRAPFPVKMRVPAGGLNARKSSNGTHMTQVGTGAKPRRSRCWGAPAGGQRGPRSSGPGSAVAPWTRRGLHPAPQTQFHVVQDSQGPGTSTAPSGPRPLCMEPLHRLLAWQSCWYRTGDRGSG